MTMVIEKKERRFQHQTYCSACGVERRRKELVYFIPEMKTYCRLLNQCNNKEKHPHLSKHGPKLIHATDQEELIMEMNKYYSDNAMRTLFKIIGKAISVRVEPQQALYMGKVMQKLGLSTVQDILRYFIDEHMGKDPLQVEGEKLEYTLLGEE